MATQPRRAGSESTAAPASFSYAQAAKGLSGAAPSSTTPSKSNSGSNTPSKESRSDSVPAPVASVASWADDAEREDSRTEKTSNSDESRPQAQLPMKQAPAQPPVTASGGSSPDLGASSASTAVKEDDVASLQNAASESTWDSKSQASTSVERNSDRAENTSEKTEKGKGKSKNAEKVPAKPLQDAPIPTVNPWARRMEEQKAKVAQKPAAKSPALTAQSNGIAQAPSAVAAKKSKAVTGSDNPDAKDKTVPTEGKAKAREQEKDNHVRKESRLDADADKTKKGSKGKAFEKDPKAATAPLPLPPTRDQDSWPTPESALDEDRKKTQGKADKVERDRKENAPSGKKEWVTVPYTPSVIFNTPLPNTATSRRGGRGGARGGSNTGRGGGFNLNNNTGNSDKDASGSPALTNGDHTKRGRLDGSAARDASPKDQRAASASSTSKEGRTAALPVDKSAKSTPAPEADTHSRKESVSGSGPPSQNNAFPRQFPSNRQGKGRRGDIPPSGDRRKEGELVSPTKENAASYDRRTSAAAQTDGPEDVDRRPSLFQDGQAGLPKTGSNDRRAFNSFSGRERGRGGGRGGRGGFQNGHHQFANGHVAPPQSSSTFPLSRSPTTFQPDQTTYFPPQSGHGRNYRNGPRSQSVTNENMYGRVPYSGIPQQLAPIQTFNPSPMYDFVPPVSAVPFSPYGVDHWTLTAMVSTQMEYYFSVENLCKDIFLRKHMDSQGFVFLSVIADFNRIRQLTTNTDIIKHVCHSSPTIEYRVGVDGRDRLRRREGWEQWVLTKAERDSSAQNDGPEELHNPPVPHFNGFDQQGLSRYPDLPLNGAPHTGNGENPHSDNAVSKGKGKVGQATWQDPGFTDREWDNETLPPRDSQGPTGLDHGQSAQANGINGFGGHNGLANGTNGHPIEPSVGNNNNA